MRGTLLVYGAGSNQIPIINACRRLGWRSVAIDRNSDAPGAGIADRFIQADLRDQDTILRKLDGEILNGVIARVTDRVALDSSRRIAGALGLVAPCSSMLAAATSKVALAEICQSAGLPTPHHYAEGEAIDFQRGPVILRPDVTIIGKAGIHRIRSAAEFDALRVSTAKLSGNGKIDVAQWIEGSDVSVLAQLNRGEARRLALWDEWVAIDQTERIVGVGAGMPSVFESETNLIDETLAAVAERFHESRCLIMVSFRIDPDGQPWLIEIHLGIGGDAFADHLLPAALPGFDVFDSLVAVQTGESWLPPVGTPKPRALLRDADGWRLVEAPDVKSLRAQARASIPEDWELPWSLRIRGASETER